MFDEIRYLGFSDSLSRSLAVHREDGNIELAQELADIRIGFVNEGNDHGWCQIGRRMDVAQCPMYSNVPDQAEALFRQRRFQLFQAACHSRINHFELEHDQDDTTISRT